MIFKKKISKIIFYLISVLFVIGIILLLLITRLEGHRLVSNPMAERDLIEKTPDHFSLSYEDVNVTSEDGLRLFGWFIPSKNGAVIIAQHGYKANREFLLEEAEILNRNGFGVLLTTVRAHDKSDGEQISFGLYEMLDLEAWYEYLLSRKDFEHDKIGIFGNSMGGYLAIQYAAQNKNIKAVVAHSAFSSLDDTVMKSVEFFTGLPAFPFAPLIVFWAEKEIGFDSSDIDARKWIKKICGTPVFLMQGGKDDHISVNSGQWLYEAACEPKVLWFEKNIGHVKFDTKLPEEFEKRVVTFFDQYVLKD